MRRYKNYTIAAMREGMRTLLHTRTVSRAVEAAGTPQGLADALGVSIEELRRWHEGESEIPTPVFIRLMDIIASGMMPQASQVRFSTDGPGERD